MVPESESKMAQTRKSGYGKSVGSRLVSRFFKEQVFLVKNSAAIISTSLAYFDSSWRVISIQLELLTLMILHKPRGWPQSGCTMFFLTWTWISFCDMITHKITRMKRYLPQRLMHGFLSLIFFFQFRFFGPLALLALILCPPAAFGNFQFAFKCLTLIDSDGIIWQSDNAQPGLLQSSFCVLSHSKLLLQLAVAPFPGNLPNWSAGEHFIAWTCQWGCRFEGNWTGNITVNLCRYDTTINSPDLHI